MVGGKMASGARDFNALTLYSYEDKLLRVIGYLKYYYHQAGSTRCSHASTITLQRKNHQLSSSIQV